MEYPLTTIQEKILQILSEQPVSQSVRNSVLIQALQIPEQKLYNEIAPLQPHYVKATNITYRITTEGRKKLVLTKIDRLKPDVYSFLYLKETDDIFTWEELVEQVNMPIDIREIFKHILYGQGYIKKHFQQIEEAEMINVTGKFKLFYNGIQEKEIPPTQHIQIGGDVTNSNLSQLSDLRDANPVLYPNQNMSKDDKKTNQTPGSLMKFWTLISDNKLISTILAALILAAIYYLFKIKPYR